MTYDDIIVGAGHNGLTAAAYLARAGRRVLLLERADHVGGAAVSAQAFPGVDARLSRYSYLVSLLPRQVMADLDLDVRLVRRRYSSTRRCRRRPATGLLVDHEDPQATAAAFAAVTGIGRRARGLAAVLGADGDAGPTGVPDCPGAVGRSADRCSELVGDDELWAGRWSSGRWGRPCG